MRVPNAMAPIATVDQHRLSGYQDAVRAMRIIIPKTMARAVWLAIIFATSSLLSFLTPGHASASFCSATNCSLTLTNSNFTGNGTFGTVTLSLTSHVVTVDVNLASAYRIVTTGFPGAVGFRDNLGGGLTIGNFKSGGQPTALYQGISEFGPRLHYK